MAANGRRTNCATLPRVGASLVCLLTCLISPVSPAAEPAPPLEYQVKAAFLINFTKFIDWPQPNTPDPEPPAICILGDDPFGNVLDQMADGEMFRGRKLTVQRVHRPPPPSCFVLVVGKSERDVEPFLAGLRTGVLTVGEGPNFLREGGMIAFVVENRRVRFDINQAAAARGMLRINSKLLSVARLVERPQ